MGTTVSIFEEYHDKVSNAFYWLSLILEKEGIDSYTHIYYKAIEIATNLYCMEMYASEKKDKIDHFELQTYRKIREIAEKVHRNYDITRHDKMIVYTELLNKISYHFSRLGALGGDETPRKIYFDMENEIEKVEEKEAV